MKVMELRDSVKERLVQEGLKPYQAAILGYDIFILRNVHGSISEEEYKLIVERYLSVLSSCNLTDLLVKHTQYAMQIAKQHRNLEYEEMHKLFSLCDEIMSLKSLGLEIEESLYKDYEDALRDRFLIEKKKARLVAEDKVEEWKKDYWWYSENLSG
jgi:hypothetical protein